MDFQQVVKTYDAATQTPEFYGGLVLNGPLTGVTAPIATGVQVLPYVSATPIAFDVTLGGIGIVTINDNVAFSLANPTGGVTGQVIRYTIKNASGGALGAGTFDTAFKASTPIAAIADTFNRTLSFYFNGTNWIEILPGTDIPN